MVRKWPSFSEILEKCGLKKLAKITTNIVFRMDRDNPGRVSVSVFPTFQGNIGIDPAKVENGTQVNSVPKGKRLPIDENGVMKKVVTFCSEFLATYTLLFLGCMGCVAGLASGGVIPHEQISWTFGLAVLISVQCFGHISGSHLNPIVTVASVILGYTPLAMSPIYLLGQFAGAFGGYGSVWLLTPNQYIGNNQTYVAPDGLILKKPGLCSPGVNPNINSIQALFVEFIASSMLVLVCCAVWDRRNTDKHDSLSIRFGLTIAVLAMAAGPYTGANMNPARSFAPALFNGDWANHWVYWIGPLGAGVVMAFLYKFLFQAPPPEEEIHESLPLN